METGVRKGTQEIIFGVVMLAIGGFLWWETTHPRYASPGVGYGFDPGFFPRILLGLWIAVCVALIVRGIVARGEILERRDWGTLAGFASLTGLYIWFVTWLGFLFSSILLFFAMVLFLGYRRPVVVVLVSVGFPLLTWWLFVFFVGIPLPTSPWFNRI